MGFGCTLRTNIFYSHKSFKSLEEVLDEINLRKDIIKNCEAELLSLAVMTEPAKFWRESEAEVGETPFVWIQNQVLQNVQSIREVQTELDDLEALASAWDEVHNEEGKAIEAPESEDYMRSYFWGDYIDSVYPDNTPAHTVKKFN